MDIKHSFEKLKSVFTSDKKLAVLCAVGVLGVVLLIISEFIPSGEKRERLCGAEPGDLRRGHRKTPDRDSIFNRRSGQDPRYGDLRQRRRAGLRKK